ncbi:hypothetical protein OS493_005247 [Desmophyllum pertusum]|uniref:Uncharacterized protein n=1 Tax=Desmophyllum pertusum TaxID=174260 RepID=A0A9X0CUP2_9CNID|nr:hypothetical protein OS493_005247 [Desmophyllum pertusum]
MVCKSTPAGAGEGMFEQKELGPPMQSRSCNEHDCDGEPESPTSEKEPEAPTKTEPEVPTEKATEPPTEKATEPPTEKATEPPTETEPELPTEKATEPPTTEVGTEPPPTGPPCKRALDLGIIIDKSKSISINHLKKLIQSLEGFAGKFEVSAEGNPCWDDLI